MKLEIGIIWVIYLNTNIFLIINFSVIVSLFISMHVIT